MAHEQEFVSKFGLPLPSFTEAAPTSEKRDALDVRFVATPDIPALNFWAMQGLAALFDQKEKLFCQRGGLSGGGFYRENASRRRTIIALLGLQRLIDIGGRVPFDLEPIREATLLDRSWIQGVGDIGLLTWFTAVCAPGRLEEVLRGFELENALESFPDGRKGCTTELAWFLAGIAHAQLAGASTIHDLTDVAAETYHRLQDNQGETGIFGQMASPDSVWQIFRRRFGTLADQTYGIYAFATFARAFEIEEPLECALACANAICGLQGEQGQWWSLYDKRTGRVVHQYPLSSIYQDGIAPAGLLALGDAIDRSFHASILKGLSWVTGGNELGIDFRKADRDLPCGSIGFKEDASQRRSAIRNFLGIRRPTAIELLRIKRESRPDHFGWLLYAFGSAGLPKVIAAHATK